MKVKEIIKKLESLTTPQKRGFILRPFYFE